MRGYKITVAIWVRADNDKDATGVIDQALDEWCNADHEEPDPIIDTWHIDAVEG